MQTHNVSLQEKEGQNPGPTELIGEKKLRQTPGQMLPKAKGHPPFLPKANTVQGNPANKAAKPTKKIIFLY